MLGTHGTDRQTERLGKTLYRLITAMIQVYFTIHWLICMVGR